MQAEPDIMIRTAVSGCSSQVVELITVLRYSMSTDLLFSKGSRPLNLHKTDSQHFVSAFSHFDCWIFCFLLCKAKHFTCNLLKQLLC